MARDIKSYGKEIWLRPLHEANGDWYPWAIGHKNRVNTNESYIAAFRHVVDIFRNNGVTNVKWVHNVNCNNVGEGTSFLGFYPGDNYVDYTSIDGYNWGTTQSWGSVWQTFDQIFLQSYNALKAINKPIILAEFSSAEIGGDKAKWITDSYNTIRTSYDNIFAAVWFHENKETDWRINSSAATLEAFKKAIAIGTSTPSPTPTIPPSPTPTVTSSPIVGKIGDLNYDDKVNSTDYSLLKRYILGLLTFNSEEEEERFRKAADLNEDNKVNSTDYALLRRTILGIL